MILELLFRENVKEIEVGELEKQTKRVLVKKRRKKTEEERHHRSAGGDEPAVNSTAVENRKKWLWWGEERVKRGSTASVDQERIVICISSDGLETDMENIIGAASKKMEDGEVMDVTDGLDEEMGGADVEAEGDDANETDAVSVVSNDAIADDKSGSEGESSLSPISNYDMEPNAISYVKENKPDKCNSRKSIGIMENNSQIDLRSVDDGSFGGNFNDVNAAPMIHDVETPRAANCTERKSPRKKIASTERLKTPELPMDDDDESFGKTTVLLAPRITSHRSLEDTTELPQEVLEPPFRSHNGPGNISPMSPCDEDGEDAWSRSPNSNAYPRSPYGLVLPDLSEFDRNIDHNEETRNQQDVASPPPIFRKRNSDEKLNQMDIQQSMSNDTEVASNVDELSRSDRFCRNNIMPQIGSADIIPSYKLNSVESYKTDGSSISYFSYEDVSIEDEESEMCAVCICPYEEGDVRVFSKHCSHVFHKDCIFEWLVKGHNECPCCRTDMVTKTEIKETSEDLLRNNTERLNHAMRTAMVEAPPFRARRGPRLPRHMLAMARREAWREWRTSHQLQSAASMSQQSPNAHWLWSARHQTMSAGSANATTAAAASTATSPTNSSNNHNVDWLWTMRFENMASQNNAVLRTARSSDAIDNTMTSQSSYAINDNRSNGNALTSRSFDALDSRRANTTAISNQQPLHAGSLVIGRNLHPNWNCQNGAAARRSQSLTSSPMTHRLHPYWQQRRRDVDAPLVEIPPRPAVSTIGQDVAPQN